MCFYQIVIYIYISHSPNQLLLSVYEEIMASVYKAVGCHILLNIYIYIVFPISWSWDIHSSVSIIAFQTFTLIGHLHIFMEKSMY